MHTTNQPMGLGALFDEAIDIYCGHFRTLITIAAVLLPLALLQLIGLGLFGSDRWINMIKNGLVLPFASGALMVATVALRAGQSVSPRESLLDILPRTLKLVGGSVPDALSAAAVPVRGLCAAAPGLAGTPGAAQRPSHTCVGCGVIAGKVSAAKGHP
ncbi:MAG: hypothetical protein OHK0022_08270 [Roseiflexaceae bacterium]